MRSWTMHRSGGASGVSLRGHTIVEAIESNFQIIANDLDIGNAAGYELIQVVSSYRPDILGGAGGVEVVISARGAKLVNGRQGDITSKRAWIYASSEDLPSPYTHELRG